MAENCAHLQEVIANKTIKTGLDVCEECIKTGSTWVHLRVCQTCGETRCCDSSIHKHATKHFHRTGHPVIASAEQNEYWLWCYPHEAYLPFEKPQ